MGAGKTVKKKERKKKLPLSSFLIPTLLSHPFLSDGTGREPDKPLASSSNIDLFFCAAAPRSVFSAQHNGFSRASGWSRGQPDLIYPQMGFRVPPRTSFAPPTPSTPLCNNERRTRTHECEPASQGACCTHARLRLKTGRRGRGREKGFWFSGVFTVIST